MARYHLLAGVFAVCCCGAMLIGIAGCNQTEPSSSSTSKSSPDAKLEESKSTALLDARALLEARRKLDQTVYRDERLAQQYERVLIRLWDRLRNSDPFEVLGELTFDRLEIKSAGTSVLRDWGVPGIRITPFDGGVRPVDVGLYRTLLKRFRENGWEIQQTEWHHAEFEPPSDGVPARSTVSMSIHAFNGSESRRAILNGKLHVEWSTAKDQHGLPVPAVIRVAQLKLIDRVGEPIFKTLFKVDVAAVTRGRWRAAQPILLHDLNGDGLSEIILLGANLLFWNRGAGTFEPEQLCDVDRPLDGAGILADVNGDGRVDLIAVARGGGKLQCFAGTQNGGFEKTSRTCFDRPIERAQGITAGDIDGDGDLDLFVFQYKQPYIQGQMPTPYYDANDGYPSFLLTNDGSGRFSDATEIAGLASKRNRRSYSAALVDLDEDSILDLLVVSDFAGLDVYRGDGTGKFEDVTNSMVDRRHAFGMAHTMDDFDGDGAVDLYMIGMSSTTARRLVRLGIDHPGFSVENDMRSAMGYGNRMFLRRADRYEDAPFGDGVARTGWSWGVTSADFDNDADRDLYVANGHVSGASCQDYCTRFWSHDIYTNSSTGDKPTEMVFENELRSMIGRQTSWNGYEKNVLYLNDKGKEFLNVGYLLGVGFRFDSRAVVSDDLDGDGRMDLLVVEIDQQRRTEILHVLQNRLPSDNHWIGVRLRANPAASPLGAKVTVSFKTKRSTSRKQVARVVSGDSYKAQHAPTVHFGLGPASQVESIEVRWINGQIRRIENPAVDQYHLIDPPKQ
jgi:hypothetical protein